MTHVRVYVTGGASRRSLAAALLEYRRFRDDPEAWAMLESTVAQIRLELVERRRRNRSLGWDLRDGWTADAEYERLWREHGSRNPREWGRRPARVS